MTPTTPDEFRPRVPTPAEVDAAAEAWGFNCGPATLCAALGLTPDEVRPHFPAWPGYTNPTTMAAAIRSAGWRHRESYRNDEPGTPKIVPGGMCIVRVQFGGRWTRPGVPMRARYPHTHWVAWTHDHPGRVPPEPVVYDVNAYGWVTRPDWEEIVLPALLSEIKGTDGTWWATHVWAVRSVPHG